MTHFNVLFLVAAILSFLIGPFLCREHWDVLRTSYSSSRNRALLLWDLVLSELGASVVTYGYPVAGTPVPTAAQAALLQVVTCTVNFADADTTATITHNFAASAAAHARLEPFVRIYQNTGGTPSPLLIVTLATNTIVLTKQSTAAGSGGTVTVIVERPHSIIAPNF